MDIQHLVDRLEDLIDEGRHLPFSKFTVIDEERALEIIDQMRISIPEEIEKAARVLAQRDRILAQANEEAARLVQLARERGDQMIDKESLVGLAKAKAEKMIEAANTEADNITAEADDYVLESLRELEARLNRMIAEVRNGISQVMDTNAVAPAAPAVKPSTAVTPNAPSAPTPFIQLPQRQTVDVGVKNDKESR
jgi:cell division septum initiation protein DivIVA